MRPSSIYSVLAILFLVLAVACASGTHQATEPAQHQSYLQQISPPLAESWNAQVHAQIEQLKAATVASEVEQLSGKVLALVGTDGKVQSVRLLKSSGVKLVDDLAVQAFKKASPLPAPPARLIRKGGAQIPWVFNLKK